MIFLEDVREIDLPLAKLSELTRYRMKAVAGFMKVSNEKARKIIKYLQQIYAKPPIAHASKPPQELQHDRIIDIIYALGELIGYKPEKKWRHEGYRFDVVWFKPPRVGPKYVFEVHLRGSLEAALLRLKHAHDIPVSTEDKLTV